MIKNFEELMNLAKIEAKRVAVACAHIGYALIY